MLGRHLAFFQQVWDLVRLVPRGRVVTYGKIALWLGRPRSARVVGDAMFHVPSDKIPWHRVINAQGRISEGGHIYRPAFQRQRLAEEGIIFDKRECIDLTRFGWVLPSDLMADGLVWLP